MSDRMTQRLAIARVFGLDPATLARVTPTDYVWVVPAGYAMAVRTGPFGVSAAATRRYGPWTVCEDQWLEAQGWWVWFAPAGGHP